MADYTSSNGSWSDGAAWTPPGVPGPGDTATVAPGTVVTLDIDVTGLAGLTVQGELTWGTLGRKLNMAGDITLDRGVLTFGPSTVLEFDNAGRTFHNNSGFGAAFSLIRSVGTTATDRFTVRTVGTGGTNAVMATNNFDLTKYDLHHGDFIRFGHAGGYAIVITYNSRSHILTLEDVTLDADCGQVAMLDAPTTDGGWDIEDCRFDQTNLPVAGTGNKQPLILKSSTGTITGARKLYRCTFEEYPLLTGRSLDAQDLCMVKGWDDGSHAEPWTAFSGSFVRLTENTGQNADGDLTDCVLLFDSGAAPSVTGTSSGSNTSTTLNDTSKAWTTDAYAPAGSLAIYLVEITGGTGVGQRRMITGNTATGLTVAYRWDTTPDGTSAYSIIADIPNNHGVAPSTALTSGSWTVDGLIAQSAGCDTQGDVVLHMDATGVVHTIENCLILPNGMGDSSGTLATLGNQDNGTIIVEHNTAFTGAQAAVSLSEGGPGHAGALDSLKSNLFWCEPARAAAALNNTSDRTKYFANGGAYGPLAATDTDQPDNPSLGTLDLIDPANLTNNATYGVLAGSQGKGYNLNLSAAPDSTNLYGVDPGFVDISRSFWGWAVTRGSTAATISGQIADGIAYLRADPTLTRTSLRPYLQGGFAPTNAAYSTSAHDGATIGAVQVAAPTPTFNPAWASRVNTLIGAF